MFSVYVLSVICIFVSISSGERIGDIYCPDRADGQYPHPTKCQLYIDCKQGIPKIFECNEGFGWNIAERRCTYRPTECRTIENIESGDTQENVNTCPSTGNVFIASPKKCNKYYRCINGVRMKLECENGKLFNYQTGQCEFTQDENVCIPGSRIISQTVPQPTFQNLQHRCTDKPNGLFPDLNTNCRRFYQCDGGAL
ncbi:unnamed protein product, partial [Didymodactylos carnosus]